MSLGGGGLPLTATDRHPAVVLMRYIIPGK